MSGGADREEIPTELPRGEDRQADLFEAFTGPEPEPTPDPGPRTLGGLPVVGPDHPDAVAMEERLKGETWEGVAAIGRGFTRELPVAWIEAVYRVKLRGKAAKGEVATVGLFRYLLNQCVVAQACECYQVPSPGVDGAVGAPSEESPAARKKRLFREASQRRHAEALAMNGEGR